MGEATTGHRKLLQDLVGLLKRATRFDFHDFKGESATPKVELVMELDKLSDKAKNGVYDDEADEHDVFELRSVCEAEGMSLDMIKALGLAE